MLIWSPHDNPFILCPEALWPLTPASQTYSSPCHTSWHSAPSFLLQKCTVCDEACRLAQWSNCVSVPRGEAREVEKIVARMCSSQANERAAASHSVPKCLWQPDFNAQRLYIKHSLCRAKRYIRIVRFKQTEISSRCRGVTFFYQRKTHTWTWNDKQWNANRPEEVNCPLCAAALLQRDAQCHFCSAARCLCYSTALMHTDQ